MRAAAPPSLPGQELELKTLDGWTLKAKYLPAKEGRQTFVLLHGAGYRKEFWRLMARTLAQAGYGFAAVDLRGHGESATGPDGKPAGWRTFKATKAQNDFASMTLDIQAVVSTLTVQGVAEESIGLIGTDVGGSLALKYAAVHPKVPLVVMLSPGMSYQEVLTVNAMRVYKDRPILMIYSELDRNSAKATPLLYQIARGAAGDKNVALISVPDRHGVKLLNAALASQIVDWIYDPVKPLAPAVSTATAPAPAASTKTVEEEPLEAPGSGQ